MPRSEQDTIAAAVALLEHVRARPKMYILPWTAAAATTFLGGVMQGLGAAGLPPGPIDWWQAQAIRGWKRHPTGPASQMRESGMDEAAIITELIDIHLELLRARTEQVG